MTDRSAAGPVWENSGVVNNFVQQVHGSSVVFGFHRRPVLESILDRLTDLRGRVEGEEAAAVLEEIATKVRASDPDQDRISHLLRRLVARVSHDDALSAAVADLASMIRAHIP